MCAGVPCMSAGQELEPGTRTRTNFAMLGPAEKKVCKRRISATFSGTRTIFIRSVNGALVTEGNQSVIIRCNLRQWDFSPKDVF